MTEQNTVIFKGLVTETEVVSFLGLTKGQLQELRLKHGLPFVKINRNCRLYFENDIIEFCKGQRTVLNQAENDS